MPTYLPAPLRAAADLIYESERGAGPSRDGHALALVDLDRAPLRQAISTRLRRTLVARQTWQALTAEERDAYFQPDRLGVLRPSPRARELRYVEGVALVGTYHGNFARWTFVDCDVSQAEFVNCNMTAAVFSGCTQIDGANRLRIYSAGGLRANLTNCVGLDDEIIEDLVGALSERTAYRPQGTADGRIGWRMNSARVAGLGVEFDDAEPAPTWEGLAVVGAKRERTVRRQAGRITRQLADMTGEGRAVVAGEVGRG